MRVIYLALLPLLVLGIINVLIGDNIDSITIFYERYDPIDRDLDTHSITLDISVIQTEIAFLVAMLVAYILLGITIVSTGLSGESVRAIGLIIFYAGIFSMVSALAWNLLMSNPIVGGIIFSFIIILYIIGVGEKLSGG